jgi:hypothetical protein
MYSLCFPKSVLREPQNELSNLKSLDVRAYANLHYFARSRHIEKKFNSASENFVTENQELVLYGQKFKKQQN